MFGGGQADAFVRVHAKNRHFLVHTTISPGVVSDYELEDASGVFSSSNPLSGEPVPERTEVINGDHLNVVGHAGRQLGSNILDVVKIRNLADMRHA
jgi:hypothetical protein